eukprot:4630749-Pleurochrysis_carterae.AAC.1
MVLGRTEIRIFLGAGFTRLHITLEQLHYNLYLTAASAHESSSTFSRYRTIKVWSNGNHKTESMNREARLGVANSAAAHKKKITPSRELAAANGVTHGIQNRFWPPSVSEVVGREPRTSRTEPPALLDGTRGKTVRQRRDALRGESSAALLPSAKR